MDEFFADIIPERIAMDRFEFTTTQIGKRAWQILSQDQQGHLLGVTSRGAFLHFPTGQVVFLSYEPYKGPLTLNLHGNPNRLDALAPGIPVAVRSGNLHFFSAHLCIDNQQATVWQAPSPAEITPQPAEIQQRLAAVARRVLAQNRTSQVSALLAHLVGIPHKPNDASLQNPLLPDLEALRKALNDRQYDRAASILTRLSGFGAGLTPSGDDLTVGLLLALNRWKEKLAPETDLQAFNQAAVQSARGKTTSLSASLIECAARGEADERLIAALDGIMTGGLEPGGCASRLLSWGSSSGGDSLTGMALAFVSLWFYM